MSADRAPRFRWVGRVAAVFSDPTSPQMNRLVATISSPSHAVNGRKLGFARPAASIGGQRGSRRVSFRARFPMLGVCAVDCR